MLSRNRSLSVPRSLFFSLTPSLLLSISCSLAIVLWLAPSLLCFVSPCLSRYFPPFFRFLGLSRFPSLKKHSRHWEYVELTAKLLDYFLRSNESNSIKQSIKQFRPRNAYQVAIRPFLQGSIPKIDSACVWTLKFESSWITLKLAAKLQDSLYCFLWSNRSNVIHTAVYNICYNPVLWLFRFANHLI